MLLLGIPWTLFTTTLWTLSSSLTQFCGRCHFWVFPVPEGDWRQVRMVVLPPLVVPNAPSTRLDERVPTLVIVPWPVPFLSMPFPLLLDMSSCTHNSFQGKLNIFLKTSLLRYTLHALQFTNLNCKIPGLERSTGEGIGYPLQCSWTSLVAQLVKNLPLMQETCLQSLGWEESPGEGKGYFQSWATITTINFRTFSSPTKETLYP